MRSRLVALGAVLCAGLTTFALARARVLVLLALATLATPAAADCAARSRDRAHLVAAARELLAEIETRFGKVRLVSTCRPGAVVAGTRHASQHRYGRAFDFYPPRGTARAVVAWRRRAGGVGTYSGRMRHVHADVGGVRSWHTHVGGKKKRRTRLARR